MCLAGCDSIGPRYLSAGAGFAGTIRTDENDGFGPSILAALVDENGDQIRLVVTSLQTDNSHREELWQVELGTARSRPRSLSQRTGPFLWESGALLHFGEGDIWGIGVAQLYGVVAQTTYFRAELGAGFNVWIGDVDDEFDSGAEIFARSSVLVKF